MLIENYSVVKKSKWTGRIDSEDDFDSFRWHQWMESIDLNDESLDAYEGKLGFAILGFACDTGVELNKGRVGAAKGPKSIRDELSNLPWQSSKDVEIFDAGDISCNDCTLDQAQDSLAQAVEKILNLNLFPILLGGDHSIAFGHYKGIFKYLAGENEGKDIGIVNFDAHFDLRPYKKFGTSGTMFNQIADLTDKHNINYSYLCLGIQKHGNTLSLFKRADELGVKYILAKDIANTDYYSIIERLDDFIRDKDHLYITLCSDVFSSAFAPGVSAPQALGLYPDKVLNFLKYLLRSKKAISFDIAEVAPRFDLDNTTANLASVMIFAVVNTLSKVI